MSYASKTYVDRDVVSTLSSDANRKSYKRGTTCTLIEVEGGEYVYI